MKKWISLLFAAIVFMGIAGCSEAEDVNEVNKQTILVYMPWSGSTSSRGLYNYFLINIDSIKAAIVDKKAMNNYRLMVFLSESSSSSRLFEISYDGTKCVENTIKEYNGNSYTTAEGITEILNDVKSNAYALNYAMIIGGHGTGWTYHSDWENYPYNAKSTSGKANSDEVPYADYNGELTDLHTRFIGSVADTKNYATNIGTLADGIANAGIRLQYVLFDNCYMANVETAYELRNVTNFLIASTSEILSIGLPYRSMWSSLASAAPNYASAVTAFGNFYKNYQVPSGALTAIDCREIEQLAVLMQDINQNYSFDDSLRDSLQILDGFQTPVFYDLGDYVNRLCKDSKRLSKFNTVLTRAIKSSSYTDSIYSHIYKSSLYIKINTFSGMTISDPSLNSVALKGMERTSWWKATH